MLMVSRQIHRISQRLILLFAVLLGTIFTPTDDSIQLDRDPSVAEQAGDVNLSSYHDNSEQHLFSRDRSEEFADFSWQRTVIFFGAPHDDGDQVRASSLALSDCPLPSLSSPEFFIFLRLQV